MKAGTFKDRNTLKVPHASEGIQADRVQEETKGNGSQYIG